MFSALPIWVFILFYLFISIENFSIENFLSENFSIVFTQSNAAESISIIDHFSIENSSATSTLCDFSIDKFSIENSTRKRGESVFLKEK